MRMRRFVRIAVAFVLLLYAFVQPVSGQQVTKVKGVVTDSETGGPVPFAVVYFKGTTVGVTTDMDGLYYIETRQSVSDTIVVELMGYDVQQKRISVGGYTEADFVLHPSTEFLEAVVVKPDDSRTKAFVRRIYEAKKRNNPANLESFNCKTYNKMELGITNLNPKMKSKIFQKNFGFVFMYMDTSVISGKPYLPVMISETSSRLYNRRNPPLNREVIEANRISGIDNEYSLSQFTGQMHARVDLYDNYVDMFDIKIASPLNEHGFLYYDYYLVDSLSIEGRKTYKLRFHPKSVSSPVFDGEIQIDSATMALREAHVKLMKGVNVNWIRDMVVDVEYQLADDSTWFYKGEKLYLDFSVTMNDSSKLVSFIGNKTTDYSDVKIGDKIPESVLRHSTSVVMNEDVVNNSEEFWEQERPFALSRKEQNIYHMVDSIKRVPLFNTIYNLVYTLIKGYYKAGPIEIGPYYKLVSFNNLEGVRLQFGARTTNEFSKKLRLTAHAAYGTKDGIFKGGGSVEYMFDRHPVRKLTATYKHDAMQLGAGEHAFSEGNILGSLLSRGSDRLSMVDRFSLRYDHEWREWFNTQLYLEGGEIHGNRYVPLYFTDGTKSGSVNSTVLGLALRFGWNESVTRGHFDIYRMIGDYPVLKFDFNMGIKDLFGSQYEFYRAEAGLDYNLALPPLGVSRFSVTAGKIWGRLPYPLLKLHEGNATYFNNPGSFSCMNYYEFASDRWVSWFYEHDFKGFFLSKIPLLKRLKWREVFSFRGVVGTLEDKNNGSAEHLAQAASGNLEKAKLLFPEGMGDVSKPYMEAGVGITNIFKIFRVDSYWRLNHRHNYLGEKNTNWVINFGIELQF